MAFVATEFYASNFVEVVLQIHGFQYCWIPSSCPLLFFAIISNSAATSSNWKRFGWTSHPSFLGADVQDSLQNSKRTFGQNYTKKIAEWTHKKDIWSKLYWKRYLDGHLKRTFRQKNLGWTQKGHLVNIILKKILMDT